jgi:signal transduction histidine kinase
MIKSYTHYWKRSTELTESEIIVVENVFTVLRTYVIDVEQLYPYDEGLRQARALTADQKTQKYIKTYYELELFITSSRTPIVKENLSIKIIREQILAQIEKEKLPLVFQVIFASEGNQGFLVNTLSVTNLFNFSEVYINKKKTQKILQQAFDKVLLTQGKIVQQKTVDMFVQSLAQHAELDTLQAFRYLYWIFFVEIRQDFGDKFINTLFRYDYDFFRLAFGTELAKKYLDLLPEGVLEVERLRFLSREELEDEIKQRTSELENFNVELEKRVSERTRELEEANKRLRELDKVKTEFISVAAHQFRTPLAAIKWTLSTVLDGDAENLTSEQKMLLMQAHESTDRVILLINQMLVVTRIESGKVQYEYAPIQMNDLVQSVLRDFKGRSEESGVSIEFNAPSTEVVPYIQADPEKIRSVIQNLVENAFQYTRKGGKIEVSVMVMDGNIQVDVTDNGIGIPEKQHAGIFNKFFRADNAKKERADGSGLGLYIIKSVVESHGGRVWFVSKENIGTTFSFVLPIAKKQDDIIESERRRNLKE